MDVYHDGMDDFDDPTPKYQRIADELAARITAGTITGRLPSEQQLIAEFRASRGTVRRSVEVLVGRGLVYTVPQRGSYVTDGPPVPGRSGASSGGSRAGGTG
jgi:GntR family transcriptional regulator